MSEIMPTPGEVRERFIDGFPIDTWAVSREECGQDFDRWKAEVERAAAARALEEAASWMQDGVGEAYNPSETDYAQQKREAKARRAWLRARAAEIRGEHGDG